MTREGPNLFSKIFRLVVFIAAMDSAGLVHAETLEVGADKTFHQPSEAARAAKGGDTIRIDPGEYFDCATWSADRLTIEGTGPGVVITDKTCGGKALFITQGNDIVIRNITFARARVADENGAGIRAEGKNLTVEGGHFMNNEAGIIVGDSPDAQIKIIDSEFTQNGKCGNHCIGALTVGRVGVLQVLRSQFTETISADHVSSSALQTELVDDKITDGPKGTSSYLVVIRNGGLLMKNCMLEKGPNSSNPKAAVFLAAGGEGSGTQGLHITGNHLTNEGGNATAFTLNYTGDDVQFDNNVLEGPISQESTSGKWRNAASLLFQTAKSEAHLLVDEARHFVAASLRKIGVLRPAS